MFPDDDSTDYGIIFPEDEFDVDVTDFLED